jgi:hypothetical protein
MRQRAGNKLRSALNIGTLGQNHIFRDVVGGKEKSDFYSFRLGYSSNFSLRLDRLKANANVMLMNGQGKMVMQSKRPKQKPETINMNALGAGTYYVKVFSARRKDKTRYQLRLSAIAISRPPEPSPISPPQAPPTDNSHTEQVQPSQKNERGSNPPEKKGDSGKLEIVPNGGTASTGGSTSGGGTVSRFATRLPVTGTLGNDILNGGSTNSDIRGFNGFDTLIGGRGADRFWLGDANNSYYLGPGYAVIQGFNQAQGDEIIVTNNIFYSLSGYRLVYDRFYLTNAFGQSFDIGTAAIDTAIYWNNDLLAIVQDVTV